MNTKDLKILLDERFESQEKAKELSFNELQRRLEILNHAHEQAREKERDFVSIALHNKDIETVKSDVKRIEGWQSRLTGAILVLAFIGTTNLVKIWTG